MVIRTSFELESALLGSNFEELIEKLGGKGAGLALLEAALKKFQNPAKNIIKIPKYSIASTETYNDIESLFLKADPFIHERWNLKFNDWNNSLEDECNTLLLKVMKQFIAAFPAEYSFYDKYWLHLINPMFHIRSSTTCALSFVPFTLLIFFIKKGLLSLWNICCLTLELKYSG